MCMVLRSIIYIFTFSDAFKKSIDKFGKINIVINNAGIMTKYITSWELAIDLNFVSLPYNVNIINNNNINLI